MKGLKGYEYDVKCRKCGKISRMYFGTVPAKHFRFWVNEHSTYPIEKQCNCDNGMMMLHDIVSFGNILKL